MTWRGFCEVFPESRYTSGFPFTSRSRIGKSARTRATSSAGTSMVDVIVAARSLRKTWSGRRAGAREVPLVPGVLEPVGQLGAALLDDPAGHEDVHEVRPHVPQDAGVVG